MHVTFGSRIDSCGSVVKRLRYYKLKGIQRYNPNRLPVYTGPFLAHFGKKIQNSDQPPGPEGLEMLAEAVFGLAGLLVVPCLGLLWPGPVSPALPTLPWPGPATTAAQPPLAAEG